MVSGRLPIVHSDLLRRYQWADNIGKVWRNCLMPTVPCPGTHSAAGVLAVAPVKHQMKRPSPFDSSLLRPLWLLPRYAGRALIWLYRHTLSALVGYNCRHLPTCSVYADEAIARFGLWGGGWMTLARLLRCHPFGTSGIDNVPLAVPPGARWYLPWRYGRWRGVNAP